MKANRDFSEGLVTAFNILENFVKEHSWLADVCTFCEAFTSEEQEKILASTTTAIEEILKELTLHKERVQKVPLNFTIDKENRMLSISCEQLVTETLATLENLYLEFTDAFRNQTLKKLTDFISTMNSLIELLGNPPSQPHSNTREEDLAKFSRFSAKVAECKKKKEDYSNELQRMRADMALLRTTGAAGSSEDAALEMDAVQFFEKFVKQLQDALPIISKQTDMTLSTVRLKLESLQEQCYTLYVAGTTGEFLKDTTEATHALDKLTGILTTYDNCYIQVEEFWMFHDAMSEQGLFSAGNIGGDESSLEAVDINQRHILIDWRKAIEIRRELWEYFLQSTNLVRDWMNLPIKQLPLVLIEDKLNGWNIACLQVEESLTEKKDPILDKMLSGLERLRHLLSFAAKLQSSHMTEGFFRKLYSKLSIGFDWRNDSYSLADWEPYLLDEIRGPQVKDCVDKIFVEALSEITARKRLTYLKNWWNEYGIQVSTCVIATTLMRSVSSQGASRSTSNLQNLESSSRHADFNVLAEFESFHIEVQKTNADLNSIFANSLGFTDSIRYEEVSKLKSRLEFFSDFMTLAEELQCCCQFFLANIDLARRQGFVTDAVASSIKKSISEWQNFVNNIVDKPRFLSWPINEQSFVQREFSKLMMQINETMESEALQRYFDFIRIRAPRLFALSNWEIICLTAHLQFGGNASGLKLLGKYLTKCFSHVTRLIAVAPDDERSSFTAIPQIEGVLLCHGERLNFCNSLSVSSSPDVLVCCLEEELQRAVINGISSAVVELENSKTGGVFTNDFIKSHSSQSLTVGLSVKFGRTFMEGLEQNDNNLSLEMNYYAKSLFNDLEDTVENYTKAKNLITLLIYQRDVISLFRRPTSFTGFFHSCKLRASTTLDSSDHKISDLRLETGGTSPAIPYLYEPICGECWSSTAVLTPQLAQSLSLGLFHRSFMTKFSLLDGDRFSGRTVALRALANLSGRPIFNVDCSAPHSYENLRRVLATSVALGSFVIIREVNDLENSIMGQLYALLSNLRLSIATLASSATKNNRPKSRIIERSTSGRSTQDKSATPSRSRRTSVDAPITRQFTLGSLMRPETTTSSTKERMSALCETGMDKNDNGDIEADEVIDFDGLLIPSSINVIPQPLIFCTFSEPISTGLRLSLRPITISGTDLSLKMETILAIHLLSFGFLNPDDLSKKAALIINRLDQKLGLCFDGVGILKSWRFAGVMAFLSKQKRSIEVRKDETILQDPIQMAFVEEICFLRSLNELLSSRISGEAEEECYKSILKETFQDSSLRSRSGVAFGYDPTMVDKIEATINYLNLDCQVSQIAKILQLHTAMYPCEDQTYFDPIIITGPSGSGKSTIVQVLAATLNKAIERFNDESTSVGCPQQSSPLPWGMRNSLGLAQQTIRVMKNANLFVDSDMLFNRIQKLKQILAGGLYTTMQSLRSQENDTSEHSKLLQNNSTVSMVDCFAEVI